MSLKSVKDPLDKAEILNRQVEKLNRHFEALKVAQYMELLEKPWRLIAINFVGGLARGLGIAIGATVVFAVVLAFLKQIILLNIPVIGGVIADIIHIVETRSGQF